LRSSTPVVRGHEWRGMADVIGRRVGQYRPPLLLSLPELLLLLLLLLLPLLLSPSTSTVIRVRRVAIRGGGGGGGEGWPGPLLPHLPACKRRDRSHQHGRSWRGHRRKRGGRTRSITTTTCAAETRRSERAAALAGKEPNAVVSATAAAILVDEVRRRGREVHRRLGQAIAPTPAQHDGPDYEGSSDHDEAGNGEDGDHCRFVL
jgi:hypothetical protein